MYVFIFIVSKKFFVILVEFFERSLRLMASNPSLIDGSFPRNGMYDPVELCSKYGTIFRFPHSAAFKYRTYLVELLQPPPASAAEALS